LAGAGRVAEEKKKTKLLGLGALSLAWKPEAMHVCQS